MLMLGSVWQFTIWVWYLIGGEGTRRRRTSRILLQAKVFLGCCVTKEKASFPLYTIGMIDLVERIKISPTWTFFGSSLCLCCLLEINYDLKIFMLCWVFVCMLKLRNLSRMQFVNLLLTSQA